MTRTHYETHEDNQTMAIVQIRSPMHRFTEINVNAEMLCGNWSFLPKLALLLNSTIVKSYDE